MVGIADPLEVKGLMFKNRIVMPPMNTDLATTDGEVTEKLIEHYTRRSKSLGLMIVEQSCVSLEGKLSKRQLGIYDDRFALGLKKLSGSVHATGTLVVIQLNHGGTMASEEITRKKPVAPSNAGDARELTLSEIEALTQAFGMAAVRAVRAGFDGVEVHGAHGFLINQFYSPLTNRRQDNYGGPPKNRMRFPLEIVSKVKEKIGERLLLFRLGSDDLNPKGIRIQDSQEFAAKLQEAGVDIIDVSGGLVGSRPEHLQGKQGYFIPQARRIKKAVSIPVIGVGGITEPEYANKLVKEGYVDLVAVGRELLRDPDWATKAIKKLRN
jgi:2,4-dienoyl-CoA reductase-like NADH-dependent reductase (Old Yellow Enzyme family)